MVKWPAGGRKYTVMQGKPEDLFDLVLMDLSCEERG